MSWSYREQLWKKRIADGVKYPTDLCALFHADASNLEQQLLGVYRTVVLRAREEDISAPQVTNRHQFDRIEKTICWVRL